MIAYLRAEPLAVDVAAGEGIFAAGFAATVAGAGAAAAGAA